MIGCWRVEGWVLEKRTTTKHDVMGHQTIHNKLLIDLSSKLLIVKPFHSVPLSSQDSNDTLKSYGINLGVPNQRN